MWIGLARRESGLRDRLFVNNKLGVSIVPRRLATWTMVEEQCHNGEAPPDQVTARWQDHALSTVVCCCAESDAGSLSCGDPLILFGLSSCLLLAGSVFALTCGQHLRIFFGCPFRALLLFLGSGALCLGGLRAHCGPWCQKRTTVGPRNGLKTSKCFKRSKRRVKYHLPRLFPSCLPDASGCFSTSFKAALKQGLLARCFTVLQYQL